MAIAPLAPARLSTTTVCPKLSVSFCPTARPIVSGPPAAAVGMISRMGFAGYCCAGAATASAATSIPQKNCAFIGGRRLLCHEAREFGSVLELLQPQHRVAQLAD